MAAESLRRRLAELLGFAVPPVPDLLVRAVRRRDGYVEQVVSYTGDEGDVPALLLVPERPCGVGVVMHHQHHAQWQFGKSEVAGLCGDPWQAFGPALARRGVTVVAPDAVGFEDRRPGPPGTDARESDATDYFTTMCCRLVRGRPLMCTVLADAAAAHSVLVGCDGVEETRIGALGHSMGGASVLLHAALDQRIAFAVVSGSACTYREGSPTALVLTAPRRSPACWSWGTWTTSPGWLRLGSCCCVRPRTTSTRVMLRVSLKRPDALTGTREHRKPLSIIARMVGTLSPSIASTPSSNG